MFSIASLAAVRGGRCLPIGSLRLGRRLPIGSLRLWSFGQGGLLCRQSAAPDQDNASRPEEGNEAQRENSRHKAGVLSKPSPGAGIGRESPSFVLHAMFSQLNLLYSFRLDTVAELDYFRRMEALFGTPLPAGLRQPLSHGAYPQERFRLFEQALAVAPVK